MDEVRAWQNRPLESVYPIVYFDCIVVKVRQDKRIINKAVPTIFREYRSKVVAKYSHPS